MNFDYKFRIVKRNKYDVIGVEKVVLENDILVFCLDINKESDLVEGYPFITGRIKSIKDEIPSDIKNLFLYAVPELKTYDVVINFDNLSFHSLEETKKLLGYFDVVYKTCVSLKDAIEEIFPGIFAAYYKHDIS